MVDENLVRIRYFAEWTSEPREPWVADAACLMARDPEVFFPEAGASARDAKEICASCDVRQQCLDYALKGGESHGVWGGYSARERRPMELGFVVPEVLEVARPTRSKKLQPRFAWSAESDALLRTSKSEGRSDAAIARTLGISPRQVEHRRRRLNVPSAHALNRTEAEAVIAAVESGLRDDEVAAALGFTSARVGELRRKAGLKPNRPPKVERAPRIQKRWWTAEEGAKVAELNAQGFGDCAIARHLGRPLSLVHRRRHAMGLPTVGRPGPRQDVP